MSDTDTIKGLTQEQVDKLTADGLFNETVKSQSKSVCQIVAGNVFTYFNLIFAIFACLLILVRSYINMTFLPIIVINTLIGIIQELRTKRVLDRLTLLNAPKNKSYKWVEKSQKLILQTLVKGDLCRFKQETRFVQML